MAAAFAFAVVALTSIFASASASCGGLVDSNDPVVCPKNALSGQDTRLVKDESSLLQVDSTLTKRGRNLEGPRAAAEAVSPQQKGPEALVQMLQSQRAQAELDQGEQQYAKDAAAARFAVGFVVMLVAVVVIALLVLCYVAQQTDKPVNGSDAHQSMLRAAESAPEGSPVQGAASKGQPLKGNPSKGRSPSPRQSAQAKYSPRSPRQSPASSYAPSPAGLARLAANSPRSPRGGPLGFGASGCIQLSPELSWAVVPPTSKLFLNVPTLLQAASEQEQSLKHTVKARSASGAFTDMIAMQLLRAAKDPSDESGIDEYLTFNLPENPAEELVTCTLVKPDGGSPYEYHLYLFGNIFFGTVMEDQPGSGSFTLWQDNQQPALVATVQGGFLSSRKIEIVTSQTKDPVVLAIGKGQSYNVECFPNSDILLAVAMLAGVDRLSAIAK